MDADEGWLENKIDACKHCSYCHYGLKQEDKALMALLRSFSYDIPRAEICCDIGRHMFDRQRYKSNSEAVIKNRVYFTTLI